MGTSKREQDTRRYHAVWMRCHAATLRPCSPLTPAHSRQTTHARHAHTLATHSHLQALLCAAEPTDPQDAEVAKMYMENRPEFNKKAKFWTDTYANEKSREEAVARVCEMGFEALAAREALDSVGWDEQAAVNSLLGM